MAEDRGGLQYAINVDGNFDAKLDQVIQKLTAVKQGFDSLGSGARKISTTGTKRQVKDLDAVERKLQSIGRQQKILSDSRVQAETRVLKEQRKSFNEQTRTATRAITASEAQAAAAGKNLKAENALAIKKAQVLELQKRANISQAEAARRVGVTASQAKLLGLNMRDASSAAGQFLFTFRRLVGILAVFTLARKFAQSIGAAVREMSSFNAELEQAQTSIATIIASVGQIYDAQGNLLQGAEEYNAALAKSGDLVLQLRRDAIGSISTFEELTRAFQVAVGPGLSAGLDLDQIRIVSKGLAEGAKVLGVPINQLSEEIRSLLKGTATARNTRLAQIFGGAKEANEAIRLAKERGNLFEVLTEKLAAVSEGSQKATENFNVLASDLEDAVKVLLAQGGLQYFDSLKDALRGLRGALVEVREGETIVSPQALAIVREMGDALSTVIDNVREFTNTSEGFLLLQSVLQGISGTLKALAPLAVSLFAGLVAGAVAVLKPIAALLDAIGDINQLIASTKLGKVFLGIFKYTAATLVALIAWKKILIQIGLLAGAKGLAGTFKTVQTAIGVAVLNVQALNGKLTFTSILGALLNKQLDAVVIKSTLASAGITLLIGALVYGVARMTLLATKTEDTAEEAEKLLTSVVGAASATDAGAKSAKEWADALRDAKQNADIAEATAGLEGFSRDIIKLLREADAELQNESKSLQENTENIRQNKEALEERLKVLEETAEIAAGAEFRLFQEPVPLTPQEEIDKIIQESVSGVTANIVVNADLGISTEEVQEDIAEIQARLNAETARLKRSEEDLLEIQKKRLQIIKEEVRELIAENTLINEQAAVDIAGLREKAAKASTENLQVSFRELTVSKAQQQSLEAELALSEKRRTLEEARLTDEITKRKEEGANVAILTALEDQLTRSKQRGVEARASENAEMDALEAKIVKQQGLLEGDVGIVVREGFEAFYRELPTLGEQMAATITDSLSELAGVVAGVFKDAVDPRTSPDIKTAFGEFFLNLAGQFVEQLTQQLIAKGIENLFDLGTDIAADAPQIAATTANTTALTATTAALAANTAAITASGAAEGVGAATEAAGGIAEAAGAAGGLADAAQTVAIVPLLTALTTVVTTLLTAQLGVQTAQLGVLVALLASTIIGGLLASVGSFILIPFLTVQIVLQTVMVALMLVIIGLLTALLAVAIVDLVTPFKKGGLVKGYASGGKVGDFPRPNSIPASDTVQAWLTPGEFVLPVKAVKKLGLGALESLRAGIVPPSFELAGAHIGASSGIRGYAAGGTVQDVPARRPSRSGGQQVILPVMPTTNENMDKMISGGKNAFTKNMNSVNYTGDPNKSGGW